MVLDLVVPGYQATGYLFLPSFYLWQPYLKNLGREEAVFITRAPFRSFIEGKQMHAFI